MANKKQMQRDIEAYIRLRKGLNRKRQMNLYRALGRKIKALREALQSS
jgi:hypothetical protein